MNLRFVEKKEGPAIILTASALATMRQYQQIDHNDKESGGQLFAIFEGTDTVIIEATRPKLLDRRTRYKFMPNRWLQQKEIQDRYKRGLHFVGDWHTHPESIPHPSIEDIVSITECFKLSHHELRAFAIVVVGSEPFPAGLSVILVQIVSFRTLFLEK